jgi:N-methylhydantoinase A
MRVHPEKSRVAIQEHIALPLGLSVAEAAAGIHDIVNASMASAIRIVTVERGVDPREFSMVAFGGAGPVHAVRVASEYDLPAVIVPPWPGVSSALGLLVSDVTADELRTRIVDQDDVSPAQLDAIFEELESRAVAQLHKEGISADAIELQRHADLRFRYQSHALPVKVARHKLTQRDLESAAEDFRSAYEELYGVRQGDPVQFVNYRVQAVGRVAKYELRPKRVRAASNPVPHPRPAYFPELGGFVETPVYSRDDLDPGFGCEGPAIVEEATSTTVIPPGFGASVDSFGSIVIRPRS